MAVASMCNWRRQTAHLDLLNNIFLYVENEQKSESKQTHRSRVYKRPMESLQHYIIIAPQMHYNYLAVGNVDVFFPKIFSYKSYYQNVLNEYLVDLEHFY